ncbi:SEC-C metal-binding domain-containing protein [Anaerobacillus sp. CMMVII]
MCHGGSGKNYKRCCGR